MLQSKVIASCGIMAALSIVIMLLGVALGLGLYVSPMLAGLCLIPIGRQYGAKYQWLLWAAVSLLSFILVPEAEQNLLYLTLFGLYPILRHGFMRLPRQLILLCKLLYFNLVVVAVEALVICLLVPEPMTPVIAIILLAFGNVIFLLYDFIVPRAHLLFEKYFGRFKP